MPKSPLQGKSEWIKRSDGRISWLVSGRPSVCLVGLPPRVSAVGFGTFSEGCRYARIKCWALVVMSVFDLGT